MALLKKLKSLFGLDDESQPESSRDVGVTVEKERQAGTTESTGDADSSTTDDTTTAADTASAETDAGSAEADDEPAEAAAESTGEDDTEAESEPVQEIKGIGPAYADRLGGVGIDTVADLADADPETVAAETEISETRVAEWVKRAKARR